MSSQRIGYVGSIVHSKIDRNGNTYWAMKIHRTRDGRSAIGTISGGEGNGTYALRVWAEAEKCRYSYSVCEVPIREFGRLTRDWPYLGCTTAEIIAHAKKQMRSRK